MDIEDLQRLNDRIYYRCPLCHEDLTVVQKTSNRWIHRLVGADAMMVGRCADDDYTRIDNRTSTGESTSEIFHREDPPRATSRSAYYR